MENTNYNEIFENEMKNYPFKKDEILNFIKENFNEDEITMIDNEETFNNMFVKVKYQFDDIERAIHECDCVAKEIDWCERRWVVDIINKYKDNTSVMATIWACYNGISAEEIFETIS